MDIDSEHPLRPICTGWLEKIQRARKAKQEFQDLADESMGFFCGAHDFMWSSKYKFKTWSDEVEPSFRITVNKVFEIVALFGPVLYNRNPIRTVTPREFFEIPMEFYGDVMMDPYAAMAYQQAQMQNQMLRAEDTARARLMELVLNYTPNELDLATNAQDSITEALIKGRGLLWTEPYYPPGSNTLLIGSFYDTVDNLVIDPDAETLEDAQWIARRRVHPVWWVEREFGIQDLQGNLESAYSQGETKGDEMGGFHRAQNGTNDLITYWEVYSKMGIGARMTGMAPELKAAMEPFGDYCRIVVARDVPYPLNLPTEAIRTSVDDNEIIQRAAWPVPFWADNRWPFTPLDFYRKPRSVWPISPITPGIGELKFLNWSMSFLASRIRTTCRDFVAVAKSAAEDIRKELTSGKDMSIIELEQVHESIDKVVGFLQQPQVNQDIWMILDAVMRQFDKRVGLTELMYGMSTVQNRSATEVNAKMEQINVRPDHMAKQVEQWMTEVARREAMAIRFLYEPQDVLPLVGPQGAQMWQLLINGTDVEKTVRELEYRIESGSARKPNKDREAQNMQSAMQNLGQLLDAHASITGDTNPVNNLILKWGESIDQDVSGLIMGPRIPMMPPAMPGEEGGEGESESQGEAA